MKIYLYIISISLFLTFGCESDINISNELLLSDNIKITNQGTYFHHVNDVLVEIKIENLSNYEILNNSDELLVQRKDKYSNWQVQNNEIVKTSLKKIAPYKIIIDSILIGDEGVYKIGYDLSFSANQNKSEIIHSKDFVVIQQKYQVPFRNLLNSYSSFIFKSTVDTFYVVRELNELDSLNKKINCSIVGKSFYNSFKNFNFADSSLIGYTTAARSSSGLTTDSLVNIQDTIWVYYTYNIKSAYLDAPNISSIVAIGKTELPIKIGEFRIIN